MKKATILQKILYVIMLYCILFYPPFVIGGHRFFGYHFVRIFAVIYMLANTNAFSKFYKNFSKEIHLMIAIIGYSFFRFLFGGEWDLFIQDAIGVMTLIIVPFAIIDYGKKIHILSIEQMSKYLVITMIVAVGISMAAFFVPSINIFIRYSLMQYGEMGFNFNFEQRGFGWGLLMTSSFSFIIAMVVAVGLYYLKDTKWFFLVIPFALFSCLINARTGLIVGLIAVVIYFFNSGKFSYSLIVFVAGFFLINNIEQILLFATQGNESTSVWVLSGLDETTNIRSGNYEEGTLGTLLEQLYVPKSVFGIVFGEGISLFVPNKYGLHSDVGFINHLFYGGIIYCFMLYFLVAKVCIRLYKIKQKPLSFFILITFLILNFKSQFLFCTIEMGLTMILYYTIFLYGGSKEKEKVLNQ